MFSLIYWIIIGGIAGWIAEKVMKGNHGLVTNIGLGIVGAVVAGFINEQLGLFNFQGILGSLILATAGACLVLFLYRAIKK